MVIRYPQLNLLHIAKGHSGTCICIDFDPTGKHFAVGSADASVSIWLAESFVCVRMIPRFVPYYSFAYIINVKLIFSSLMIEIITG